MGPFFFFSNLSKVKKRKERVLFSKGFHLCDLIHSQSSWGVLGEGRCHCPHFMDEGMPPERLRNCWGGRRKEDPHFSVVQTGLFL